MGYTLQVSAFLSFRSSVYTFLLQYYRRLTRKRSSKAKKSKEYDSDEESACQDIAAHILKKKWELNEQAFFDDMVELKMDFATTFGTRKVANILKKMGEL